MSENPSAGGRRRRQRPERLPHHISSIAHLFFDEGESVALAPGPAATMDFAVTSISECRLSAYACAGLVAGARNLADQGEKWGVRLAEDPGLEWSADSFLPEKGARPADGTAAAGWDLKSWDWPPTVERPESPRYLRWSHLASLSASELADLESLSGSKRSAPAGWLAPMVSPGRHGLVMWLLAPEMGLWSTAFGVGRLLGVLVPRRVEILVFPERWASAAKKSFFARRVVGNGTGSPTELFARGRDLTRAVAGACPVTITAVPDGDAVDDEMRLEVILQNIAARLAADFSVDLTR